MKNEFPHNTIAYLKKLTRNNNREWFEKNREMFNRDFLQPAVSFVEELGEKISVIVPGINAIPKIDKSIFRLHRDVRFSKDKSPYKTNLGILFWEGKRKKMECSGFYFHVDPKQFFLGAGMYMFSNDQLKKYREIVYNPDKGKELKSALSKVIKNKNYKLGGKVYKKIPRGFDPGYPYAEFLLYNGFYTMYEGSDFTEMKDPVNFSFKVFKEMQPVHNWLVKNMD